VVATLYGRFCCFLSHDGYASRIQRGFSIIFGVTNCTFERLHVSKSTLPIVIVEYETFAC
jgi:hypothetical protein